jgi:double zinc ribbon protein
MTFCPTCQYLNPNNAKTCQSCGASLVAVCPTCGSRFPASPPSSQGVTFRVGPGKSKADRVSLAFGILILAALAVPWVITTGYLTVLTGGGSQNVEFTAFQFPIMQYLYSPTLGDWSWTTTSSAGYVATIFLITGSFLIIGASVSRKHSSVAATGGLFSAFAPIVFLGVSYYSGFTPIVSFQSTVSFPVGAIIPVTLGLVVAGRSGGWEASNHPGKIARQFSPNPIFNTQAPDRFCEYCHSRQLSMNDKFCHHCGKEIRANQTILPEPAR